MKDIRLVTKQWPGDDGRWWNHRVQPSAMRRLTKAWGLLVIVGLLAALAAACGGGGEPQAEGSPTPPPTGQDAALAPCQALEELETYRFTSRLRVEAEKWAVPAEGQPTPVGTPATQVFDYVVEASYQAPDRIQALTGVPGGELPVINIGDERWYELGGGWTREPRLPPVAYQPITICRAIFPDLDLSQAEPQQEAMDEVKTLHYHFDDVHSEEAIARIPAIGAGELSEALKRFQVDVWLAEKDGWPVRVELRSSGELSGGREASLELSTELQDVNDKSIKVEPPSSS